MDKIAVLCIPLVFILNQSSILLIGRFYAWVQEVALPKVESSLLRNVTLNLIGMGATLIGLQVSEGCDCRAQFTTWEA